MSQTNTPVAGQGNTAGQTIVVTAPKESHTVRNIIYFIVVIVLLIVLGVGAYYAYKYFNGSRGDKPDNNTPANTPMSDGDFRGQIIYNTGGVKTIDQLIFTQSFPWKNIGRLTIYWNTNANGEIHFPESYTQDPGVPHNFKVHIINAGTGTVVVKQPDVMLLCPYHNCEGTGSGSSNITRGPYWFSDAAGTACFDEEGRYPMGRTEGGGERITLGPYRATVLISCNYNVVNTWFYSLFPVPAHWDTRNWNSSVFAWVNGRPHYHLAW